jgi:tetrapyrrole methylase family protein/MazG family protein
MLLMSCVDKALELLGYEGQELQLASAGVCLERHYPGLSPDRPALISELEGADLCRRLSARLALVYPASHPVTVLAGLDAELPALQELALSELERAVCRGVSMLYLPPVECPGAVETFQATVAHLRAPDGCPWDREQTHQSLRTGFLEEAYEVLDALDQGDLELLKEELGDVLLHILMQAQIASENGEFCMRDVICHVNSKIVYRHPHVFADLAVEGVSQVLENWEALKRKEKGRDQDVDSLFDGIPDALPALARTQALMRRAEKSGVVAEEWTALAARITDGAERLQGIEDRAAREASIGELLFELGALAAFGHLDAEGALRDANLRFEKRALAAVKAESPAKM